MDAPNMQQVRARVTIDCWVAGCGWSSVGWNYTELRKQWKQHATIHAKKKDSK